MAMVLFWHGFDNWSKLVYAGEIQKYIAEWKWPHIFQNKRVRCARADKLELYSSRLYSFTSEAQTPIYVEVLLLLSSRIVGG